MSRDLTIGDERPVYEQGEGPIVSRILPTEDGRPGCVYIRIRME